MAQLLWALKWSFGVDLQDWTLWASNNPSVASVIKKKKKDWMDHSLPTKWFDLVSACRVLHTLPTASSLPILPCASHILESLIYTLFSGPITKCFLSLFASPASFPTSSRWTSFFISFINPPQPRPTDLSLPTD